MKQTRKKWIDVLKFIGIFEIYLGHFGEAAGRFYPFVFTHHVALFFFISGYLENLNDKGFVDTLKKKFGGILLPFYFFGFLSISIYSISNHYTATEIHPLVITLLQGAIRNQFFAASLWFLSAIFVVSILFHLIKLVKNKIIIVAIAVLLYFLGYNFIPGYPSLNPSWYYNLDSALYFLIFYVLGYVYYPFINILLKRDTKGNRKIYYFMFVTSSLFTIAMFFGTNLFTYIFNSENKYIQQLFEMLTPLFIIYFFIFIAHILQNVKLFNNIGKNTLYLCGNETIIRIVFPLFLSLLGFGFQITSPSSAIITTMILLVIVDCLFVPWEKKIIMGLNYLLKLN